MASIFSSLKDKASSHLQSFAEKMLIQQRSPSDDLRQDDEEVLDVIVDEDDGWGKQATVGKAESEDFFS